MLYDYRMQADTDDTRYYVRATNPENGEQIAFECIGLALANAKAAELRMARFRDVVMSVAKASEDDGATT